jgi:hypothetical protein
MHADLTDPATPPPDFPALPVAGNIGKLQYTSTVQNIPRKKRHPGENETARTVLDIPELDIPDSLRYSGISEH